jgi:XTP/dITP diphosphohydrolase
VTARPGRPRLVLATANRGKVAELVELLAGLDADILTLADYPGLTLPPEGTTSYADNARAKARTIAAHTGLVALGDDSGLEVEALGWGPGVASARYGGPGLDDAGRVTRLLAAVGAGSRRARFRCLLALAGPEGREVLVEGLLEGHLAQAPRGTGGFGYDPVFVVPELGRTVAELAPDEKNRLSHRARAVGLARPTLARWLAGGA